MSCTICTRTKVLNLCFADITFGQFSNGAVRMTFVNNSDGSRQAAEGTASGGNLKIDASDMVHVVDGVSYTVTASEEWTLDGEVIDCATLTFQRTFDNDGEVITGTNETLETA